MRVSFIMFSNYCAVGALRSLKIRMRIQEIHTELLWRNFFEDGEGRGKVSLK